MRERPTASTALQQWPREPLKHNMYPAGVVGDVRTIKTHAPYWDESKVGSV
jgi:hypothetical protein